RPVAHHAALRLDIAACDDGTASTHAGATDDAPTGPHDGVYRNAPARHDGAGKDDGGRVDGVDLQYVVGGTELVEQPAGVIDAPVGDQGIQHGLVVTVAVVVAQEPFVAAGAWVLGFDEILGKLHDATQ